MKFFKVFPENSKEVGIAYLPNGLTDRIVPVDGMTPAWRPVELTLRQGSFSDYLGCDALWHLCSPKMRRIIDDVCESGNHIEWLDISVVDRKGIRRPYQILHLVEAPDVLNVQDTVFEDDGFVRKPVIDSVKAVGLNIFRLPNDRVTLFVSEVLKKQLEAVHCTGMGFQPARSRRGSP
jgi:hypothetical protein